MDARSEVIARHSAAIPGLRVFPLWTVSIPQIRLAVAGTPGPSVAVCDPDQLPSWEDRQQLAEVNVLLLHVPASFKDLADDALEEQVQQIVAGVVEPVSSDESHQHVADESEADALRATQIRLPETDRDAVLNRINDSDPDDDGIR